MLTASDWVKDGKGKLKDFLGFCRGLHTKYYLFFLEVCLVYSLQKSCKDSRTMILLFI